jgi:hypothetical protein
MLLPGFGDAHAHPMFGGLTHARCPIVDGKTPAAYQALIAACAAKQPGSGTLYGIGWAQTNFPGATPDKTTLDAISRKRAIIFGAFDGHAQPASVSNGKTSMFRFSSPNVANWSAAQRALRSGRS